MTTTFKTSLRNQKTKSLIETQKREIAEIRKIIYRLENAGK